CRQVLEHLGASTDASPISLDAPAIVVADTFTPRQMRAINRDNLRGLLLGRVGVTSHPVILGRSFGVPAIVDVSNIDSSFHDGTEIIVDANAGHALPHLTEEINR